MKQSTKKKLRDIRNAFVMVCVMVAMLSTASYAWFTLTDSPTVTNLQMTAAAGSGLKVSKTGTQNTFYDTVDFTDETLVDGVAKKLRPVAPNPVADGSGNTGFSEALYADGKVTGLKSKVLPYSAASADLDGYVLKTEYWLMAEEGDANVAIICGAWNQSGTLGMDNNNVANLPGSFVRNNSARTDSSNNNAAAAVRVGFVVGDAWDNMIIWEPNADAPTLAGTEADDSSAGAIAIAEADAAAVDIRTNVDGTMSATTAPYNGTDGQTSKALFTVGTNPVKVTMFIWIQGSDDACVNEIQTDNFEAQIQFTAVDDEPQATP